MSNRPIFATRASPKRPVSQSQILKLEDYKAAIGDLNQRPIPDRRSHYPISIIKVTRDPVDCPVFGEQIDNITASLRPLPDFRAHYPISIVQVSGDSAECQVFGKQIDIMTASLRPRADCHDVEVLTAVDSLAVSQFSY